MSSNIQVQRICQFCGSEFTAKKTVTKTCSDQCAKRLYKQKLKENKISESNKEASAILTKPLDMLKAKEFLTISEACILLSVSRWTIWRAIKRDEINAGKIGRRTLIRRSDVDKLFEMTQQEPISEPELPAYDISDCYTLNEIKEKYRISEKALYEMVKRNNITKIKQGWSVYVPKTSIDQLLSSNKY